VAPGSSTAPTPAAFPEPPGTPAWLWAGLGAVLVVLGGVALVLLFRRPRATGPPR